MKRLIALLLLLCLLLCGCREKEASTVELPDPLPQGPHRCYDWHSNDHKDAHRVALYGDQVYFGCNCGEKDRILTMPAVAPSRLSVALDNGRLLRACGTVLLANKEGQLLGMDLAAESPEWKAMLNYSPGEYFLPEGFQRGEEWVLLPDSDRTEVLCVRPAEMTAVIQPSVGYIDGWAQQGETLYYTVERGEGSYTLYSSDLYFRNIRLLMETEHPELAVAGDRIACYGGAGYPGLYDLKTESYQPLQIGYMMSSATAGGGVLILRHWKSEYAKTSGLSTELYAVDIATGEELNAEDYSAVSVSLDGAHSAFFSNKAWRFAGVEQLDPYAGSFDHFAVGDRYIVCNNDDELTVIHRERNRTFTFNHSGTVVTE